MPPFRALAPALSLLLLLSPGIAPGGEFEERITLPAGKAVIRNLIGEARIEPSPGPDYEIVVRVQGKDATRERVRIERAPGDASEVVVRFPLEESRRFVYPRLGRGRESTIEFPAKGNAGDSWISRLFGTDRIVVRGSGNGLEVWADVLVRVPPGSPVAYHGGVGKALVSSTSGDAEVELRAGPVEARGIRGDLRIGTGAGNVAIGNLQGDLRVEIGAGDVSIEDLEGDLHVETGAGAVTFSRVRGGPIGVETGAGDVTGEADRAGKVSIESGAGAIALRLSGDLAGPVSLESGVGAIHLSIPATLSARISAESGVGGIDFLFPEAVVLREERGEKELRIGEGKVAIRIETGAGSIRVSPIGR